MICEARFVKRQNINSDVGKWMDDSHCKLMKQSMSYLYWWNTVRMTLTGKLTLQSRGDVDSDKLTIINIMIIMILRYVVLTTEVCSEYRLLISFHIELTLSLSVISGVLSLLLFLRYSGISSKWDTNNSGTTWNSIGIMMMRYIAEGRTWCLIVMVVWDGTEEVSCCLLQIPGLGQSA